MAYPGIVTPTSTGNITTQNLVPAGTATAGSAVEITLNGATTLAIQTTGTYTGALTLQATVNGTAWVTLGGTPLLNVNTSGYLATITSALQSLFQADVAGFTKARITALAAVTGTATISLIGVVSSAMVALDTALPTGSNTIGAITGTVTSNIGTVTAGALALMKLEDSVAANGDSLIPAGVIRIDAPATQVSASGDYAVPLQDSIGRLWVNSNYANIIDTAHSHYRNVALTNTGVSVKPTPGNLYGFNFINTSATDAAYVKFYNSATAPTAGAGTPFKVFEIPAAASATSPTTVIMAPDDSAYAFFSTGIGVIVTKSIVDTDTTAPTATIYAEIVYK